MIAGIAAGATKFIDVLEHWRAELLDDWIFGPLKRILAAPIHQSINPLSIPSPGFPAGRCHKSCFAAVDVLRHRQPDEQGHVLPGETAMARAINLEVLGPLLWIRLRC
jgi:hypothetical protein